MIRLSRILREFVALRTYLGVFPLRILQDNTHREFKRRRWGDSLALHLSIVLSF